MRNYDISNRDIHVYPQSFNKLNFCFYYRSLHCMCWHSYLSYTPTYSHINIQHRTWWRLLYCSTTLYYSCWGFHSHSWTHLQSTLTPQYQQQVLIGNCLNMIRWPGFSCQFSTFLWWWVWVWSAFGYSTRYGKTRLIFQLLSVQPLTTCMLVVLINIATKVYTSISTGFMTIPLIIHVQQVAPPLVGLKVWFLLYYWWTLLYIPATMNEKIM